MIDEITIPNDATYSPVSLLELGVTAPLVSRLLLGATLPGRLLQIASLSVYGYSALNDWVERFGVRRVDFQRTFGADVRTLPRVPRPDREADVQRLVSRLNADYTPRRSPRRELAVQVDQALTDYIASITGQRVRTSTEIRSFSLAGLVFPFALGAADVLSGDVAILKDTGPFEPHVVAHEFAHRKGYLKELHAQALAYFALAGSGVPELEQAARCERLLRQLSTLADHDPAALRERVRQAGLRPELERWFLALRPPAGALEKRVMEAMKAIYEARMRVTGQNGLSDYDEGFTALVWATESA